MEGELSPLIITAVSIAFFHTIFGPDHYLPFIMMSWARKWSALKTFLITLLCGLGHIASSVVLGLIGVAMGIAVNKLEVTESVRGNLAAWLLIAFGLVYLVWGVRRAYRNKPHSHSHHHPGAASHVHSHTHHAEHAHVHSPAEIDGPATGIVYKEVLVFLALDRRVRPQGQRVWYQVPQLGE